MVLTFLGGAVLVLNKDHSSAFINFRGLIDEMLEINLFAYFLYECLAIHLSLEPKQFYV